MRLPAPSELLRVFDLDFPAFAVLTEVDATTLPEPHRTLLVHREHMTVAMESYHRCQVNVDVIQFHIDGLNYTREILLRRASDQAVVQYGIARLHLECLPEPVRVQVLARQVPLGRILISNNLFRHVELGALWRVNARPELRSRCENQELITYARTALIHLNEVPAIELLEMVVPRNPVG